MPTHKKHTISTPALKILVVGCVALALGAFALRLVPSKPTILTPAHAQANATIWVNPANTGVEDGLTKATGYNTLWEGMAAMSSGDTVIIANGDWTGYPGMSIEYPYFPPSGTPDAYTKIHAETDWETRLNLLRADGKDSQRSYVEIRGIVFDSRARGIPQVLYDWHHTKIIRSGFLGGKMSGNAHGTGFGSPDATRQSNHHNLMEEVIAWGGGRYIFYNKYGQYNVFRRTIARRDYVGVDAKYGGQFANFRDYASDYAIHQNNISIDSDRIEYYNNGNLGSETVGYWLGDQYGTVGNEIHGSISIKDIHIPYYISGGPGVPNIIKDSVALDVTVPGGTTMSAFILANDVNLTASNILGMGAMYGTGQDGFYNKGTFAITNSILKDVAEYAIGGAANSYINHYNADKIAWATWGAGETTYDPEQNGLLYPVRIEAGSLLATAGENGARVGPEILYMIGRDADGDGISGLLYGEPGWDEVQDGKNGKALRNLWPWPNEDNIKELMSETVEGVPGVYGFTAYQSPFGSPNTLTSYIWEYLGNKIPCEVYDTCGKPQNPPQKHPSIFFTPERLSRLKADAASQEPHWAALKQDCDDLLSLTPNYISTVDYGEPLALCYQITNDPKYAAKSLEFMKNYLEWLDDNFDFQSDWNNFPRTPTEVFNETDYGNFRMTSVAIAFDWIYDELSTTDRDYFITMFNKVIDSAMVRKGYGYNDPTNNHAHTKNRTEVFLGLASLGDNPRADEFITTAYDFFTNKLMPIYNQYNPGGEIYMGTNYGYRRTLLLSLYNAEALKTASSIDLYVQNPWFEDVIYYLIHAEMPKNGTTYTHGTRATGGQLYFGTGDVRDTQFMSFLRGVYADTISGEYLEDFMNKKGINKISSSYSNSLHTEYKWLFRDIKVSPRDYSMLSPAYLTKGLGLFLARSDWSENALWMSLQGGDYVGDHQYFDMGHFTLFRGQRLVSNGDDSNLNRVLIGQYGFRQDLSYLSRAGFSPSGSQVEEFENTDDYAYVKLDLTRTYYGSEFQGQVVRSKVLNQEVSKTTREAVLLRPDYILLYDYTGTLNSTIPTTWVVSADSPSVNISDDTYSWSVSGNDMYVRTLLPETINATTEAVSSAIAKIKVTPQTPIENEKYLHLFYAPKTTGAPMVEAQNIEALTNNMVGALVQDSTALRVVMFSNTATPQTNVIYTLPQTTAQIKHLITNLEPNFTYNVYQDGNLLTTKTAGDAGTVYFVSQGASRFEITQGAQTLPPQTPNITLLKSVDKTTVEEGDTITYTITYQNTGAGEARNITITDTIPQGTSYVQNSATQGGGVFDGVRLMWTIPILLPNAQGSVSFQAQVGGLVTPPPPL